MAVISKLVALLGVDPREFDKNLKAAERTLAKTAAKMQAIGRDLTIGITAPVAAIGGAAVKSFADFDSALTKSTAIMGDVSDSLDAMEKAALDVARTTTFSAEQAAEAFFFLASAGLDAEKSIDALPAVAQFAQAGMFDLATATDLLTDAQSALGLKAEDTAENLENMIRVGDVLVKANTIANASVQQFSESLTNQAAAAARFSGIALEETVAVLAAFADQGIKGAEAGTKFSIVIRDLTTKAALNAKEFERFGVAVFDVEGNLRPMAEIIRNLEDRLGGLSVETQKMILLQLGFADRSVQVLQTLLGTSGAIAEYERQLKAAGGTTQEVADKQMEAFSAQLILVRNQINEVLIQLGKELIPIIKDDLIPIIQDVIEFFSGLVKIFGMFDRDLQRIILGFVAFAAAIGPALLAAGAFLKVITAVAAVLSGPGIALIVAGGGLLTGLGLLATGFDRASEAGKGYDQTMRNIGKTAETIVDESGKVVRTQEEQFKILSSQLEDLVAQEDELLKRLENKTPLETFLRGTNAADDALKKFGEEIRFNTILDLAALRAEIDRVSMAMMEIAETPSFSPGGQIFPGEPVGGDTTGIGKLLEGFKTLGEKSREVFEGIKEVGSESFRVLSENIDATVVTNTDRLENFFRTIGEKQEQFRLQVRDAWTDWLAVATDVVDNVKLASLDFFQSFAAGFGDAIAQIVVFQKDFEEVMLSFLKNLLAQVVSTLTQIVAEWLLATIAQSVIGIAIHSQRVAQALQLIYLNAFASYAAIPLVGPAIAPGLAAVAVGVASAGSVAAAATGPAVGAAGSPTLGLDTGGLILADGIANLHQGERVLRKDEVRMMPDIRGGGMMHVTVELDGRVLTTKILPRVPHELRMRGV